MAKDTKKSEGKATKQRDTTWIWIAVVIVLLSAFVFWRYQSSQVFELTDGDDRTVLVLLRGSKDVFYQVHYTGRDPISIKRIQLKLITGPDMDVHTDVEEMKLVNGAYEIVLDPEGHVADGDEFVIQPGETFEIQMRLQGQSLGINRLEGFLISLAGEERPFELKLEEAAFTVE